MTTTDTTALDRLEALAKAATPGDFDTADHTGEGLYECPCCDGEGQVPGKTLTNFDGFAIGVQFFGVGDKFANYEDFARAANPATILEMLATIREQREALAETINALGQATGLLRACEDDIDIDVAIAVRDGEGRIVRTLATLHSPTIIASGSEVLARARALTQSG